MSTVRWITPLWAVLLASCTITVPLSGDDADESAPGSTNADQPESRAAAVEGYVQIRKPERLVGGPTDVETDLIRSFPKPDSVLPGLIPKGWFEWKKRVYESAGLELGVSYQMLFQHSAQSRTEEDHAFAGWLLIETKWEAINRGEDFAGNLIATFDWRHTISGGQPSFWGVTDLGSLWPTDLGFFELGPAIPIFYWEQWFSKDRFVLRLGKQIAPQTFDFFRYKDGRTSFSASPLTAHTSIPSPPFGQAVSFKWWPIEKSSLYVVGTLNDMNGDPERIGFDTFFEKHQFFYGLEVGYFWKRGLGDFDHIHLNLFWADEKDTQAPGFPNTAGGGFKVLGSKQWGQVVAFGSYTFNTAEGGGFGVTFARHTATAGVAYVKPAGIRGEIGLGTMWMHPINDALRDQYGGELYWKLLLTPDFWLTPGVQLILDPSFNPDEDSIFIAQLKFRLFF
ncbi:MAG: hypothetical protein ACYS0E_11210 [Planctomycetota bacterium]|jgi:hypothetical protein